MCGVSGVFATVVTSDCSYRGFAVDAVLRGRELWDFLVVQTPRCRAANAVPVGVSLLGKRPVYPMHIFTVPVIAVCQCIFYQLTGRLRQQAGSYELRVGFG
jgi:hypothetical protein